jgi:anti-sigma factor RsiW
MNSPVHLDTGARALGALPPDEQAAFDAHLAGCDACADELAEFRQTTALLGAAVAIRPPDSLHDSVMRAIAITPQLPPVTTSGGPLPIGDDPTVRPLRSGRRADRWYRRPWTVAAAVVVAAAIAAAVVIGTRPPGPGPTEAAQQCVQKATDTRVLQPSVGSGGSVALSMSCRAAVVHMATMPDLPSGKAYQLWVLAGNQARSAGMVSDQENAAGTITVTDVTQADTGIGVSVEPASGSEAPTTQPVWVVTLTG